MRVLNTLPQEDLNQVPEAARELEAAGFDGVVTMENRHDPFLPLAVAATATEKLTLQTGVAIAFARSPMVVANLSWDLQLASRGRFTIGLGSQVKGHNVRRFSVPWSAPAPRMREYVQALRAIWQSWQSGEKLDYQGEHYQFTLMTPNFVPEPLTGPPPAITIAAVGPATLKVAAEECDGVRLHAFCTRKYLENVVEPKLRQGLEKRDRARESFEVSGGGFIATGADQAAVERMFEWVRMRIGFYGSTPSYWPVFEQHDLLDLGHKLNAMSKQGQWAKMTKEIPDDVVHLFAAVGTFDNIAGEIEKQFGGLSDVIAARAVSGPVELWPKDLLADLKRIKTPFKSYQTD